MKVVKDGIASPEVVNSFRKTKPVSLPMPRIPWNEAKSPAALAPNTRRNSIKILMLVK
jgi:hypothetical protein